MSTIKRKKQPLIMGKMEIEKNLRGKNPKIELGFAFNPKKKSEKKGIK
jgi:hypothetical protein